jgi:hypothetical protein
VSGRYTVEFERSAKKEFDRLGARFVPVCCVRLPYWRMTPGHLVSLGWLVLTIYGAFGSGTTAWSARWRMIASW